MYGIEAHFVFNKGKVEADCGIFIPLNSKSVLETMLLNTRSSEYIEGLV